MTPGIKSSPRWKRVLWLVAKIYVGLCALLVTAYLVLIIWSICFPSASTESSAMTLKSLYDQYMTKESPERDDYFCQLAGALAMRTKDAPVPTSDIFKYLGKPDRIGGTVDAGTLVYLYRRSAITNQYVVYVFPKIANSCRLDLAMQPIYQDSKCMHHDDRIGPTISPEQPAVGTRISAVAVHAWSRRWLGSRRLSGRA